MVGGYDFSRSEYNRAVQAHRQPGSAFKPLIYATAMSQGLSPATQILDAPVVYEQEEEDKIWKPENYGRRFHGMVSLRDALAQSHNLATVRLLDKVGVKNVIEFSRSVRSRVRSRPISPGAWLLFDWFDGIDLGIRRVSQSGESSGAVCYQIGKG